MLLDVANAISHIFFNSYVDDHALSIVHRAGKKYKQMRRTVAEKQLVTYPKGGVQLYAPCPFGFRSKGSSLEDVDENTFISTIVFPISEPDSKAFVLAGLEKLAEMATSGDCIQTFLASTSTTAAPGNEVVVLTTRYRNRLDYESGSSQIHDFR